MNITRECVHFLRSDKSTNNTSEEREKTLAFITRQSKVLFILCAFIHVFALSFVSAQISAWMLFFAFFVLARELRTVFGTWQEPTSLLRSSIKQIPNTLFPAANTKKNAIFTANFRMKKSWTIQKLCYCVKTKRIYEKYWLSTCRRRKKAEFLCKLFMMSSFFLASPRNSSHITHAFMSRIPISNF